MSVGYNILFIFKKFCYFTNNDLFHPIKYDYVSSG